jgi:hypothetical protein
MYGTFILRWCVEIQGHVVHGPGVFHEQLKKNTQPAPHDKTAVGVKGMKRIHKTKSWITCHNVVEMCGS